MLIINPCFDKPAGAKMNAARAGQYAFTGAARLNFMLAQVERLWVEIDPYEPLSYGKSSILTLFKKHNPVTEFEKSAKHFKLAAGYVDGIVLYLGEADYRRYMDESLFSDADIDDIKTYIIHRDGYRRFLGFFTDKRFNGEYSFSEVYILSADLFESFASQIATVRVNFNARSYDTLHDLRLDFIKISRGWEALAAYGRFMSLMLSRREVIDTRNQEDFFDIGEIKIKR